MTDQTTTDEVRTLEGHEQRLVFDTFSNDDAWELGSRLVALARERGAAVTIGIRRGAQRLFHCALPGTSADNDVWIARKSAVVEHYGESSFLVGARFRAKGRTFEDSSRLDPEHYAAHGGAFPIRVRGTGVVGVVAVSGLPQAEDHALVVEAVRWHLA
ncbi:heme-degrading domain-containing protein [Streptomyces sp. NPDC050355]|uniref:heme-degrading domain-containing protein n=1 Tax=Streptomyces sp. NPDC050355 TaxID=3365609 RepID=UPI0037AED731